MVMDMGLHAIPTLVEPQQIIQVLIPGVEERARHLPPLTSSGRLTPGPLTFQEQCMAFMTSMCCLGKRRCFCIPTACLFWGSRLCFLGMIGFCLVGCQPHTHDLHLLHHHSTIHPPSVCLPAYVHDLQHTCQDTHSQSCYKPIHCCRQGHFCSRSQASCVPTCDPLTSCDLKQ